MTKARTIGFAVLLFLLVQVERAHSQSVGLAQSDYTTKEGAGTISLVIKCTFAGATDCSGANVAYSSHDGSALENRDYNPVNATVTFAAGDSEKTISISIINDSEIDPGEAFVVRLTGTTGGTATLGTSVVAVVQIEDDEGPELKKWGIDFGVGLSVTVDTGGTQRVEEAETDANGIVRVTKDDDVRARVMLETHYFFPRKEKPQACKPHSAGTVGGYSYAAATTKAAARTSAECAIARAVAGPGDFGFGPFVAVQPGTEDIIDAIGIGVMLGFKRATKGNQSFNLGIGYVVDPSTRVLREDFIPNTEAPTDASGAPLAIDFRETDQGGILLLASFTW